MRTSILLASFMAVLSTALPTVFDERANETVNPAAISSLKCTSPNTALVSHDINVALLAICGGIAGTIEKCEGTPSSTTGASGTAKFSLATSVKGATMNVSKGRWEGCVRAARVVCGDAPSEFICIGGASTGNINVVLAKN